MKLTNATKVYDEYTHSRSSRHMRISRTQVKLMNTGEAHEYMRWQIQQHLTNIADACITTEAHDVYTHSRSLWTQSKLTNTREVHEHMTVLQHMRDSPMQQKVTNSAWGLNPGCACGCVCCAKFVFMLIACMLRLLLVFSWSATSSWTAVMVSTMFILG